MADSGANDVRLGVIGLGNIGQQHIKHITSGAVSHCRLAAVCSRKPVAITGLEGIPHFSDSGELIDSGLVDAVLVATPTLEHYRQGALALAKGLHVLMEKPIGLSCAEGEQLVGQADKKQVFALMLNHRTDPLYILMKKMVSAGELGRIQRTHWTMTDWFRPEVYFQVSDWRATWKGEGGGLLVNQCIHNLDIFQWICGLPEKITAFCGFGRYHNIEVEDECSAFLTYPNGATGTFIGSTGEAPGINRFEIIGDQGTLVFDGEKLTIIKNTDYGTAEFSRNTRDMFGMPNTRISCIERDHSINQHATVIQNFVNAILQDESLIAPAEEGLDSLVLANGILLSAWTKQAVDLPLDSQVYQQELDKRIAGSRLREKADIEAQVDMEKSYR